MRILNSPFITVIMPVYNAEKYLQKAIDSILNQTYKNFEFIIINDGSTDGSAEIINSIDDKRVIKIHQDNSGLVVALNIGIRYATGDWIARMDADDISYPNRLEMQIKYIQDDIAVIGSQANIIDKDDNVYNTTSFELEHDDIVSKLLEHNSNIIHPTIIINKSKLNKVGGYDPKMLHTEDYDLWLRISSIGKIINVNKPLLALRKHDDNISKIKLGEATNNAFVSLAYHFRSNSTKIMSENEYNFLLAKVSNIDKLYRVRLIDLETQKERIRKSYIESKYMFILLHPGVIYNYLLIRLLKVWVLFRIRNLKQL